jgi:hypothetical protein
MEQCTFKNVNNYLNTKIYSYLETSCGQSCNLYLKVVHFFNTSVNYTSVAAYDCCFPALVSNACCSIAASFTVYNLNESSGLSDPYVARS